MSQLKISWPGVMLLVECTVLLKAQEIAWRIFSQGSSSSIIFLGSSVRKKQRWILITW